MILHVVFHDIFEDGKNIKRKIDITLPHFLDLKRSLDTAINRGETRFCDYTLQFDEGYTSFKTLVMPQLRDFEPKKIILAIRTGTIGDHNFLSVVDLKNFDKQGIRIVSHSVTHPILALPGIPTPPGGIYQERPFGENQILTENEIYFQLNESKKRLEQIVEHEITDFALPFGGWNETATRINEKYSLYKTIYTSKHALDKENGLFKPRYTVRGNKSVKEIVEDIFQLN